MTYADLYVKLEKDIKKSIRFEIEDVLDNGFRDTVIKKVTESVLPVVQAEVLDLHQRSQDAREGICSHYRDALQKYVDRKTEGMADRIGTLEMYMPQVRMLSDISKDLQKSNELQRISTAKLEVSTEHLKVAADLLRGKVNGQAGAINVLEDQPGEAALNNKIKWKWALIGGGISLIVAMGGGILLALLL